MGDQIIYLEKYIDSEWGARRQSGRRQVCPAPDNKHAAAVFTLPRRRRVPLWVPARASGRVLPCTACRHHIAAGGAQPHPQLHQGSG